ncbi:MAG: Hef nuclease [Thermoplasmata archaeon]|nr:MAG: Hef nuclease [Thermoplasmata archaeon]
MNPKLTKTSIVFLLIVYLKHDFIKPDSIEYREYQVNIAKTCLESNTLVVLPTGLGKTVIALIVIASLLSRKCKILFLAPTKPLVNQHTAFLKQFLTLDEDEIVIFTGEISPDKRTKLWKETKIIVSTPQVIENDLKNNRISLEDFCLIIFDEAHRAVGEYSYVFVAKKYKEQRKKDRRILGMTASPGSDIDRILEICENLEINNVEIRSRYDKDVRPYVHGLTIEWKLVELPEEFNRIIMLLSEVLSEKLGMLKTAGLLETAALSRISMRKLLEVRNIIQDILENNVLPSKEMYKILMAHTIALKTYHALELIKTQGATALRRYFKRIQSETLMKKGNNASKHFIRDRRVIEAMLHLKKLDVEHPKLKVLSEIVEDQLKKNRESRIIIFTQYRDTALQILDQISNIKEVKAARFVGQTTKVEDKGLSQREQEKIIRKFKDGEYNTLVATSVAEEGLDIPSTDLVIFYEPIPSEIRSIQRKGRTARKMKGRVVILIAKKTQDEAYYWSSVRKEKLMYNQLKTINLRLRGGKAKIDDLYPKKEQQKKLLDYM